MQNLRYSFFFMFVLLAFSACKKDDTKVAATQPKQRAPLYFSAKLNGTDYLVEALVNGYGSGVAVPSGTGEVPGTYEVGMSMVLMNPTIQQGAGISIIKVFNDKPTECDEIKPMYHLGKYTFGREGMNGVPAVDGVVVFYADANGTYWTSDKGTADQTGSNFEILEHVPNNDGFSLNISKVKFNCNLYDGKGNKIVLTEGDMKGRSMTCDFL